MITPDLLGFIQKKRQEGVVDGQIRAMLMTSGGWLSSDIDEAFQALGPAKTVPAPARATPPPPAPPPATVMPQQPIAPTTPAQSAFRPQPMPPVQPSAPHPVTPPAQPVQPPVHQTVIIQPTYTGSAPKKSGGLMTKLLVTLLVLALLAGAAYASYIYYFQYLFAAPEEVIFEAYDHVLNADSIAFSFDGNVYVKIASSTQPGGEGTIGINLTGATDAMDEDNVKFNATLSLDVDVKQEPFTFATKTTIEGRHIDDVLYLRMLRAPVIGFFDLRSLENKWISVTDDESEGNPTDVAEEYLPSDLTREEVLAIYDQHPFLVITETKSRTIDGVAAFQYTYEIDQDQLEEYMIAVSSAGYADRMTPEELAEWQAQFRDQAEKDFEEFGGTITIEKRTRRLREMIIDIEYGPDEQGQSFAADFTATFSKYNEPVTVEVPTDTRPFEEVMQEVMGSIFGAMATSTKPN
jgi:hypothetical protein